MKLTTAPNYVELLMNRADAHPERVALRFLADGSTPAAVLSYADLDREARVMAACLQRFAVPNERAVILLPTGVEYVRAFLGCLYAGVIAVPAYPPESAKPQPINRLLSIIKDASPCLLLTERSFAEKLGEALAGLPSAQKPMIVAVDELEGFQASDWQMPRLADEHIAFLQYTSGSTAFPKGVVVGHDNLLANQKAIKSGFAIGSEDSFVSWLPLFHDMGLVGGLLQPLYSGIELSLMSPRHFLERPVRWLEAVSRFQATVSGGPDFAFRLCVERVGEGLLTGLDLSSWRLAFCGAEPIRFDTLQAFADKFGSAGLRKQTPYPCYGLAESTLLVAGGRPGNGISIGHYNAKGLAEHRAEPDALGTALVGCGQAQLGHEIRIADPENGRPLPANAIGEIHLSGPSVTKGYWNNPEASSATFVQADGKSWLRTGDLGFFRGDQLLITGRLKDLIVIRGQNLYPQDIEQAVEEQVEMVRKGRVAAFAVNKEGREGIGIAAEVSRNIQKQIPAKFLGLAISDAVADACQEPAMVVLLLQPGALPKTTSGKLQRSTCRQAWLEGQLDCFAVYSADEEGKPGESVRVAGDLERQIAAIWSETLGIVQIDRERSFFAQGGDSIAAVGMLAKLGDELGLRLEPSLLFAAPTLPTFTAAVSKLQKRDATEPQLAIPRQPEAGRFPLSPGQRSLWFLAQMAGDSTAYHIGVGVRLHGELDLEALQHSFAALAARHELLRTTFHGEDGQPFQQIHEALPLALTVRAEWELEDSETCCRPFDLEQGPLWRLEFVRRGEHCQDLNLKLHHLIADGWSLNRLLEEFAELYAAHRAKREACLPSLPIRYGDYAAWQWRWLEEGGRERELSYWLPQLGGEQPILELPTDHPRPAQPIQRGAQIAFQLDLEVAAQLRALAQQEGLTVFTVLLAAFNALLYRYSGQTDLRVGVPVANRSRPETVGLVGYCVNTLVLRTELDGRLDFKALLGRVQASLLGAQAHPDLPFEQLVNALQPERSLNHNPLFQVMANHQKLDFSSLENLCGLRWERLRRDLGGSQFDLSLDTEEDGQGRISGVFTYATELFEATTVERMSGHYQHLLRQMLENPQAKLGLLPLLSDAERACLDGWNTAPGRWTETPIHELFSRQAQARPAALALVCGDERLSFGELEARANRLARLLLRLGARAECVVGIALERSANSLVAMLAVLKSGAAYLPLDPAQPAERLARLLQDVGAKLLLAGDGPWDGLGLIRVDVGAEDLALESPIAPAVSVHPAHQAYIIHTSGSTGRPKGVAVAHGPLSRHIQAAGELYGYTPTDRALHFAAFSFDAAVEQWATPLAFGAGVVLAFGHWTGEESLAAVEREQITVVYPPTPHLLHLAEAVAASGRRPMLKVCTVGGEAVPRDSLDYLQRVLRPAKLINGYGPTETIITPLAWAADEAEHEAAYAPIGSPLAGRTTYILDCNLNPVPVGVAGELHIGGGCLARGYLGQPGLTAERFLPDSFGTVGGRLYRTGDRARRWADGTVEYLGRTDQQIKLRGHRIEPGEIEAALLALEGVREAVVVLHENAGRRSLLGYVGASADVCGEALRSALSLSLPEYFVPAYILVLEQLPRTAHGKINRRDLPVPQTEGALRIKPRNPIEKQLLGIWADLLGRQDIGITDSFFELGGDSILSLQVASRARRAGLALHPKDLFQHQTIEALARVAGATDKADDGAGPVSGEVPLSPIQAEFFARDIPARSHWNQALLLQSRLPLEPAHLEQALAQLLLSHDSLRLRFHEEDGGWRQFYAEPESGVGLLWQRLAADAAELTKIVEQAQRSLDLATGPLLRAVQIRLADGGERLLLVIHHLVVDGVSWRILLDDLHAAYQAFSVGQTPALSAKTTSFQAWTQRLHSHAQTLQDELPYWERLLRGGNPHLPLDKPQGRATMQDRVRLSQSLNRELTRQLLHEAGGAYRTRIQELLLAALAQVLGHWSGQPEVLLELETYGREELFDGMDLSRSVGWFTSAYPVKLSPQSHWGAAIKAAKEHLRQVPNNGLGYGLLQHLAPADCRARIAALPKPQVTFNYLGQLDANLNPAQDWLSFAPEASGEERDSHAPLGNVLEINGQVSGGVLSFEWIYSGECFSPQTVAALADAYTQELQALVTHCLSGAAELSPADFPLVGLDQAGLDGLALPTTAIEDIYPLSPMQQGILFHALQLGEADPYFYQRVFVLEGDWDGQALARAWQVVTDHHQALRSAFRWEGLEQALQIIYKHRVVALPEEDWRSQSEAEQWRRLEEILREDRLRGFDFAATQSAGGLRLLRVSASARWLVWNHHHIALDGWSMGLVLRDMLRVYQSLRVGLASALPAPVDGAAYRHWLRRRDSAAALDYWRGVLADFDTPTPLPLATPTVEAGAYEEWEFSLMAADTAKLRAVAQRLGITLNTLLQGAYALLLARYGDCRDVVFGVTVAGRSADLPGIEESVGLFINTLPLRAKLRPDSLASEWLAGLQQQTTAMGAYEVTPLADIQRACGNGEGLFESILVFENYPLDELLRKQVGGLRIDLLDHHAPAGRLAHDRGRNNYPLSLIARLDESLHLTFSGQLRRFQAGAMAVLAGQLTHLLEQLADGRERRLFELRLDNAPRPEGWMIGEPCAEAGYSTVLEAFAHNRERVPAGLAVYDGQAGLSYAELDAASNRLAHACLRLDLVAGSRVGVLLDRSVGLAIGLLAVLKAGGVYVPLDKNLPDERLQYLLADSGVELILSDGAGCERMATLGLAALDIDQASLQAESSLPPAQTVSPDQTAYLIYTSGSTGMPKGVAVSHSALAHYVHGLLDRLQLPLEASMAMVSTPAADLGHTVLFGALCSGRTLHLIPPDCAADPDRFAAYMAGQRVGVLKIVPSHLRGLLQAARPAEALPEQALISGGEACPWELVQTVASLKPACRVINHYGPTETTVGVLTYAVQAQEDSAAVPIGWPLPGVRAYVLDNDLNPAAAGAPGELYLGGPGLAQGYWQRPGLSAERFVPDPFGIGTRLYRTGDRVLHTQGRIEFLGRVDTQVKIRGFRVEPEEVAQRLRGLAGVADALVVAVPAEGEAGRLQLLAYVVGASGAGLDLAGLRSALERLLPDYMLPTALIPLERIPLTANGKPDRKALPKAQAAARLQVAPSSEAERVLADIWQTVLKVKNLGVTDSFFELGGDSILSLQIIARARKAGLKLSPKLLFEKPTIAALAQSLAATPPKSGLDRQAIVRTAPRERLPLSFGQERLWFLGQLEPDNAAYHIAGGLSLSGEVDLAALWQAFEVLAARHGMLRASFHADQGQPYQRIAESVLVPLRVLDLQTESDPADSARHLSDADAAQPFDWEAGPLWRATLVRTGEAEQQLWLTLHHLIADGWSMQRLLDEFAECYAAACSGQPASLPPLPIGYGDYVLWQRDWLGQAEGEGQSAYWQAKLGDDHTTLDLPLDRPRPALRSRQGGTLNFNLPPELAERLKNLALAEEASVFMLLLAAFKALLHRYSGQSEVRVGVPVANRSRVETEGVAGFFVNTLVIRTELEGRNNFRTLLKQVKASVLDAQNHPDLPFERLVEVLQPQRSLSLNPLFQVFYNHQKRDLGGLRKLPGLKAQRISRNIGAAQFDLSLATEEDGNGIINGSFSYAADVLGAETVARWQAHFLALLDALTANPQRPLGDIPLLSATEQAQQAAWNTTARRYPAAPIHQLIARQAQAHPSAVALRFGERSLSYGDLDAQSNRLAHRLVRLGVGPDIPVGVALERCFEMVVGLLAILKAGGAFVPLDPDYPAERLAYMLDNSVIRLVLSHSVLRGHLPTAPVDLLELDRLDLSAEVSTAPAIAVHPQHLAYVLYTSGSTGQPKGAGNSHGALANRLHWMQEAYRLGATDTVLQKTPFSFDVSVWEFFWPLLTGACLAIAAPGDHRQPERIAALIRQHRVTTLHFVPSMLQEFIGQADSTDYPSLRRIVSSGEALTAELCQRVFRRLPGVTLHNLYGPTEAAIDVTHWACTEADGESVPIGHPIANIATHVLDAGLNPLPIGVAGELYIGGVGLARGYQNRPSLTAERFLPDPWATGGRLYRTGDRARLRTDGAIEYLGRLDGQIKLRGLRIELGEIEAALLAQAGVTEAAALLVEAPAGASLVAYVAAKSVDLETLTETLRLRLPAYMVPVRIMFLNALPKMANGKLDRKALPTIDWRDGGGGAEPETATQLRLAEIWQDLLGVEQVRLHDNFFALGGHSLLAARLASRLHAEWGVNLPLRSLFEAPTLALQAQAVGRACAQNLTGETLAELDALLSELEAL